MSLSLVTAATEHPVIVQELATEILDFPGTQQAINRAETAIAFAVAWFEAATVRQYMQATWKQTYHDWPSDGCFKIDLQPLSSVTSLKYYDVNGTLTTVASTNYWVDTGAIPPILQLKPAYVIQDLEDGRPSAIELTFVAGYSTVATVPAIAKKGILLLAAYFYRQPEANPVPDSAGQVAFTPNYKDIPFGVFSIVNMLNASGYT